MNEENMDDVLSTVELDSDSTKIAKDIIVEKDPEKLKDLTVLFNLNQAKKNAIRILKLNAVLDKVSDQMLDRVDKKPGEFSNDDLVKYMNVVQGAIDKADKVVNQVNDTPMIQINSQTNNLTLDTGCDGLDRESRAKVAAAIKSILQKINADENTVPGEVIKDE